MRKFFVRFASLLLVLAVILSNVAVLSAAEVTNAEDTSISLAPHISKTYFAPKDFDPKDYTADKNEIASLLRNSMKNRVASVRVRFVDDVKYDKKSLSAFIEDLFERAFAETQNGTEGDYLRYHYRGYGATKISYLARGGKHYYDVPLKIEYFTTAKQESILLSEVKKVIESFNFNDKTTEKQKVDKIYEYITSNITYDNDNLSNSKYDLKFTAYAALVNKTAVCQGYATLFYLMAKSSGLEVRVITGESRNIPHVWNIVKIGESYYFLDSTWDAGNKKYEFYLKGTNEFDGHSIDPQFLTAQFKEQYSISETSYTDKNTDSALNIPSGNVIYKYTDGKWYYFVNGVKSNATTLVNYNGSWYYVVNGVWDSNADALVKHNNQLYLVENGKWNNKATRLVKSQGKHLYIENGLWKSSATKLFKTNGNYYYIKNGEWVSSITGLVKYSGKYYYLKNGVWTKSTTLVKQGSKYFYVKNGIKNTATTLVKYNGKYYYVKNGVWTKSTTLVKQGGKYVYVKNGIKNTATTLVKYSGKYYYVKNGVWTKSTTLVKQGSKYIYVKNGIKNTATTLVKYNGKYFYVKNGVWAKSTTLVKQGSKYIYVKNGIKNTGTTLVKYNGKYFYVKKGVWTKSTAIVKYNGKKFFVKNGFAQMSFTGKAKIAGKSYKIVKGKVV